MLALTRRPWTCARRIPQHKLLPFLLSIKPPLFGSAEEGRQALFSMNITSAHVNGARQVHYVDTLVAVVRYAGSTHSASRAMPCLPALSTAELPTCAPVVDHPPICHATLPARLPVHSYRYLKDFKDIPDIERLIDLSFIESPELVASPPSPPRPPRANALATSAMPQTSPAPQCLIGGPDLPPACFVAPLLLLPVWG